MGLDIPTLYEAASPPREDNDERRTHKLRKKRFQRTVRLAVFSTRRYDAVERMRHKLERWDLGGLPGTTANRCIRALQTLRNLVPPRVSAAVFRTMWNGWCTGRRFQSQGSCCFQCGAFLQEDSVEHYGRCSAVVRFARDKLKIRPKVWNLSYITTMGLAERNCTNDELTIRALWIYSVYKAHNLLRYKPLGPQDSPADILLQFTKEGAFGHDHAMHALDGVWVRSTGVHGRGGFSSCNFGDLSDGNDDVFD